MDPDARIESIPEEEIKKALKELDPTKHYVKGAFIDSNDKQAWRVAIILEVGTKCVSIHYEAWSDKYNESNVSFLATILSPFRKYSKGYTGQSKSTLRSFEYSNDENDKSMKQSIQDLTKDPFFIRDPETYTQFFRGKLFIYVSSFLECLNTNKFNPIRMPEVFEVLKNYMELIISWMNASFDLMKEFDAAEKYNLLYMIHTRTAVCSAYPEILYILEDFFGKCWRTARTFEVIYSACNPHDAIKITENSGRELPANMNAAKFCICHFYKDFNDAGGFQVLLKMLRTKYM